MTNSERGFRDHRLSRRKLLRIIATAAATPAVTAATYGRPSAALNIQWPAGLVAFWDFSELEPPFMSKAGRGEYPLQSAEGRVTKSTDAGPFGTGAVMSNRAPKQYLRVPANQARELNTGSTTGQVTQLAWARRINTGGSCIAGIWHEGGESPARQAALWADLAGYGGDSKVLGHVSRTGGASPGLPYSRDFSASRRQWANDDIRFVGFTYDGARAISYVDGLADSYKAYTEPGAPLGQGRTYDRNPYSFNEGLNPLIKDFLVGAADPQHSLGHMTGAVFGLAVFDRALSQAEILAIHLASIQPGKPAFKHDMVRPIGKGAPYSPGKKFAANLIAFSQAHGKDAATGDAKDHTFYSCQQSESKPYLVYDTSANVANETQPAIAWVDFVRSVSASRLTKFTWVMNNAKTSTRVRLAIRIGTSWYATNRTFACSATHTASDWSDAESFTFGMTREATSWRNMTLIPDTVLSLGSRCSVDLPQDEVTGYGFFADQGVGLGGVVRITDLQVYC